MKKVFLFLAIFMLSLSGALFACGGGDKYVDLKVELVSVVDKESGDALEYDSENNCYKVFYGKKFVVSAQVNSDVVGVKTLQFDIESPTALELVSSTDTTATINPISSVDGEKFKLSVSSIEMSGRGVLDLYFQVLLPVTSTSFKGELAATAEQSVNLTESINFVSKYWDKDSTPNFSKSEKAINVSLDSFDGSTSELTKKDDTYYLGESKAFKLETNKSGDVVLNVLDSSLKGNLKVTAKSNKYVENDESNENKKLITTTNVKIVPALTYSDISFSGNQVAFDGRNDKLKLDMSLYSNAVSMTYSKDGTSYSYLKEEISFAINTDEKYSVTEIVNGSSVNVEDSSIETISGKTNKFTISSNKCGKTYVDFKIKYEGFENNIEYLLSDLIKKYKEENSSDCQYDKICVNVYALPTEVVVLQNGESLEAEANVTIFDQYGTSDNGVKYQVELADVDSSNVQDRTVRVNVVNNLGTALSKSDLDSYFRIVDTNGKAVSINNDGTFDLNLNNSDGIFYIKAVNNNTEIGRNFKFVFENIVQSKIDFASITSAGVQSTNEGLVGQAKSIGVTTAKGVTKLVVKGVRVENDSYKYYDLTSKDDNEYNKLVVGKEAGSSIVAIYFDTGLTDETISCSGTGNLVTISDIDNATVVNNIFNTSNAFDNSTLQFYKVVQIVGNQVGSGKITFEARNGFSTSIDIVVANSASNFNPKLNVSNGDSKKLVSKNSGNSEYGIVKGNNLELNFKDYKKVISVEYTSSDENVAMVEKTENNKCLINPYGEGTTTITAKVKYYAFTQVGVTGAGYYWEIKEKTISFNLVVFVKGVWSVNPTTKTVYDSNTIAYDKREDYCNFEFAISDGGTGVVGKLNDENKIKFIVDGSAVSYIKLDSGTFENTNEFYGATLKGRVYLAQYASQNKDISIGIEIEEYDGTTSLNCQLNVVRANQVGDISLVATTMVDGVLTSVNVEEKESYDEIRARANTTVNLRTLLQGVNENEEILDKRLYAIVQTSQTEPDTNKLYATLSNDSYCINIDGGENFDLIINDKVSGSFYIRIIAKDSYTNETNYETSKLIKVVIEDGEEQAYSISTFSQLDAIRKEPNKNYQLVNDIVMSSDIWTPIDNFTGALNGNGYSIKGLRLGTVTEDGNVGLFGNIGINDTDKTYGTVYDIAIENATIQINNPSKALNVGIVAGTNKGIILNTKVSYTTISITTTNTLNVGSITGQNDGVVLCHNYTLSYDNDNARNSTYFSTIDNSAIYKRIMNGETLASSLSNTIYSTGSYMQISATELANVGGLVGVNNGVVNGNYNATKSTGSTINFVTSNQREVDVYVNINTTSGNIDNSNSTIGGVVGLNYGMISHFDVDGNIGYFDSTKLESKYTGNNVGGVAGKNLVLDVNKDKGNISDISTSVKVVGVKNVGGAVGLSEANYSTTITALRLSNIKVENYDSTTVGSLVVGATNVGGIVGYANYLNLANSYSKGYTNKFDSNYVNCGDVYIYGATTDAIAGGGLVGFGANTSIKDSFSTFNIISKNNSSNIKALVGGANEATTSGEIFYIGVVSVSTIAGNVKDILGISSPTYYYIFDYADSSDLANGTNKDCFVAKYVSDSSSATIDKANITFKYYASSTATTLTEVKKYTSLIEDIPTDLEITSKGTVATKNDETIEMVFGQNYYYFENTNGENAQKTIILTLGSNNYSYKLKDLFDFTSTVSNINLVVSIEDDNIAKVDSSSGALILKNAGTTTLKFAVKEDMSQFVEYSLVVVDNFDTLRLASNGSLTDSYFVTSRKVRVDNPNNFNYDFVEAGQSVSNNTGYSLNYTVLYKPTDGTEQSINFENNDYLSIGNKSITFKKTGTYTLSVSVEFTAGGQKYCFTNDTWLVKVESCDDIVGVNVNISEIKLSGLYTEQKAKIYVDVNNETENIPTINLGITLDGKDVSMTSSTYSENVNKYDLVDSPFYILLTNPEKNVGKTYIYNLTIVLKKDAYETKDIKEYIVTCGVENQESMQTNFNVVVSPSSLNRIDLSYYPYTQQASKLIKSSDSGEQTTFYSYSETNRESIIAGMGGLFVINLNPYYANITSVSIKANTTGSKALSFVQLVKVEDASQANTYYYIAGPSNTTNADGSLNLQLKSVLTSAKIKNQNGVGSLIGTQSSYSFGGELGETDSSGNLYVRVIAPSALALNDVVTISVVVKYKAFDGYDRYIENEAEESISLSAVEMPKASLSITHDGVARKIIAYTATGTENATTPDYLDIVANVENGYNPSLSYDVVSGNSSKGMSTDYVNLEKTNNVYRLTLGKSTRVGDIITLRLTVSISIEGGGTVTETFEETIKVVDAIVTGVTINGLDDNNAFNISISSQKEISVKLKGYGTLENLQAIENKISKAVMEDGTTPYYWFIKNGNEILPLTNTNKVNLPFSVKQQVSNDSSLDLIANSDYLGATGSSISYKLIFKGFYLEGDTNKGSASLRMEFYYVYNNDCKLQLIPESAEYRSDYSASVDFTVNVLSGDEENNLQAIGENDFNKLATYTGGHFILTSDIVLEDYAPFEANFESLDGNNKVITIKNFSRKDASSINLGLFSSVSSNTIIKNLIVVLPSSHTGTGDGNDSSLLTDLQKYTTVNYGGIAGENNGIITNCDVVATESTTSTNSDTQGCYSINLLTTSSASVNVGGLVGINNGIITNSRVGRKSVTILQTNSESSETATSTQLANTTNFVIAVYGGGNVGGFAGTNSGTISSSYADNLQLEVYSAEGGTRPIKTAGFVALNSGYIYGSFVSGFDESSSASGNSPSRKLGGGIFSNGYVAGFVYKNEKYIADCYSNINISQDYSFAIETTRIARDKNDATKDSASGGAGFVYDKTENSIIKTSYSLSKIKNSNTFGPFENYLSQSTTQLGKIENCYYLRETDESFTVSGERADELSDSVVVGTSSSGINQFAQEESFNGFSFDPEIDDFNDFTGQSSGGVWAIKDGSSGSGYPELISACTIAISCRVQNTSRADGTEKSYYTYVSGYELGSIKNPYLISTKEQYNNIFSGNSSSVVTEQVDDTSKFTSHVRLINNIDFSGDKKIASTSIEYTSIVDETAIFDGNYLAITNISLEDTSSGSYSFGLFKDIYRAGVKNLTLGISSISAGSTTAVGGLAGVIVDSNISNISLVSMNDGSSVNIYGRNYVGGLAGIVTASDPSSRASASQDKLYYVSNINSNLSLQSSKGAESSFPLISEFSIWQSISPITDLSGVSGVSGKLRLSNLDSRVSYAGGIAGVIDLRQESSSTATISEELARNLHVGEFDQNTSAITSFNAPVKIVSNYVGGLAGLVGSQTMISRSEFIVDSDSLLAAYQVAGGLAGFNYGMISRSYVSYNEENNKEMDENLQKYIGGTTSNTNDIQINKELYVASGYTPKYIGGLVGINAGSSTTGSGSIADSYNRVDVRNEGSLVVGGIVGGSYVGEIRNVYTTAGLLAKLDKSEDVYIGGIIGRVFDSSTENLFTNSESINKTLSLSNIVATNIYETEDFDKLSTYVNTHNGKIGALYGEYSNGNNTGIIRMDQSSEIYYIQYILNQYNKNFFSKKTRDYTFIASDYTKETGAKTISLWGTDKNSATVQYDSFLTNYLSLSDSYLIRPNQLYLFMLNNNDEDGSNALRKTYFSNVEWPEDTWEYGDHDKNLYPVLDYGYKSNVKRIYTAKEFIDEVSVTNNVEYTYLIMNDLDFSTVTDFKPISTMFNGEIIGSDITYEENGITYTRYPILYNLEYALDSSSNDTSKYALFESASTARISNINIVVKSYDVQFNSTAGSQASILIANADSVTLSNVNIYSSLRGVVSKSASTSSYTDSAAGNFTVTQGLLRSDGNYTGVSTSFIRTKTSTYVYRCDVSTVDGQETKTEYFVNKNNETEKFEVVSSKIKTNAEYFGGLVARTFSNSSKIIVENCSANIDVEITIDRKLSNAYYGALLGNASGKVTGTVASGETGKFSIQSSFDSSLIGKDVDNLYVGGIAGFFSGEMSNVYIDNLNIVIGGNKLEGKTQEYILVSRSNNESDVNGAFIGGVVGQISGDKLSNVYIKNIKIDTFLKGDAIVGGVVANSEVTLSDIYVTNSSSSVDNFAITAHIDDELSKNTIGGVIGRAGTSTLSDIYSNLGVKTLSAKYNTLFVGGILGRASAKVTFTNVVSDAQDIILEKTTTDGYSDTTGTIYAGGIGGKLSAGVTLRNVLSTVDITSSQDMKMFIGGAIGDTNKLEVLSTIILGNILLSRGCGDSSENFFYKQSAGESSTSEKQYLNEYCIGGLVGNIEAGGSLSTSTENANSEESLILSTIRDYAVGQKLEVFEGSVVGGETNRVETYTSIDKIYYNENISLVSNSNVLTEEYLNNVKVNGFTNIDQDKFEAKIIDILKKFVNTTAGKVPQALQCATNESSNLFKTYYKLSDVIFEELKKDEVTYSVAGGDNLVEGSKLNPIAYTGTAPQEDTYYYLTKDLKLTSSITTDNTGWVIDCRGYSINVISGDTVQPIFTEITEDSAVVGLLLNVTQKIADTNFTAIANTNNGFIFSCGVSGTLSNGKDKNSSARNVASFVYYNYGVISKSFSTANIEANAGFGLVEYNGSDSASTWNNKVGNIYDCYYTGTITDKSPSGQSKFAGMAYYSTYGVISNSYTMANIVTDNNVSNIYPIVLVSENDITSEKKNLYRTYYDYIAYVGNFEGANSNGKEQTKSIADTDTNDIDSYFSVGGIYVWTTTFSGDTSLKNLASKDSSSAKTVTKNIIDLFKTYWVGQVNKDTLKTFYTSYLSKDEATVLNGEGIFDNTWFNYGYITKDYSRTFYNENINKYFQMIYSGNGLKGKENIAEKGEKKATVAGFIDQPYQVKHGGILDMLVTENCLKNTIYRYYLFTNNIDLKKYNNLTYWSETWDYNNVAFVGDLDGNGWYVRNMFSTHGLVRAIKNIKTTSDEAEQLVTKVRNITFNGSYAKTGLVAGYMSAGEISNITVSDSGSRSNYVYNGNLCDTQDVSYDNVSETVKQALTTITKFINIYDKDTRKTDLITFGNTVFAGGLVGYMTGGLITGITIDGLGVSALNEIKKNSDGSIYNKDVSYVGGLVGVMTGGKIMGTQNTNEEKTYYIIEGEKGVVEKLFALPGGSGDIVLKKLSVSNSFNPTYNLQPYSYVGGLVGYLGKTDENNIATISNVTVDDETEFRDSMDNIYKHDVKVYGIYTVGLFAGTVEGGKILGCKDNNSLNNHIAVGYSNWTEENGKKKQTTKDFSQKFADFTQCGYTYTENDFEDGDGHIHKEEKTQKDTADEDFIFINDIYLGGIAGSIYSGTISYCTFSNTSSDSSYNIKRLTGLGTVVLGGIVGECYERSSSKPIYITNVECSGSLGLDGCMELIVGGIVGRMRNGTVQNVKVASSGQRMISAKSRTWGSQYNLVGYLQSDFKNKYETIKTYGDQLESNLDAKYAGDCWVYEIEKFCEKVNSHSSLNNDALYDYVVKLFGGASITVTRNAVASTAGGVVGKLMCGSLLGLDGKDKGNEDYYKHSKFEINGYKVISSESSGGVVGKIALLKGNNKSAEIKNITVGSTMTIRTYAVVTFSAGAGAGAGASGTAGLQNVEVGLDLGKNFEAGKLSNVVAQINTEVGLSLDTLEMFVSFAVGLSKSSVGGVVGQIKYLSSSYGREAKDVVIDGCTSNAEVGEIFSTYVGGIVGLVSEDASASQNTHTVIKNCESDSLLLGYFLKSFAGGIVGYLNHGTVYKCKSSSVFGNLVDQLAGLCGNTSKFGTVLKNILESGLLILGTPNISGGIVGYCEDGEVRACNTGKMTLIGEDGSVSFKDWKTNITFIVGWRVAGGIVGVASRGTFTPQTWANEEDMEGNQFGIMSNNGIVWSLSGIAGGLFGVVCGGDAEIVGYQAQNYSISQFLVKLVTEVVDKMTGDSSWSDLGNAIAEAFGKNGECGLLINHYFGTIMGNIAGGIVGYYDTSSIGSNNNEDLSGCLNFGRVYTNLVSIFSAIQVMTCMGGLQDNLSNMNLDDEELMLGVMQLFAAVSENVNWNGVSEAVDSVGTSSPDNWLSKGNGAVTKALRDMMTYIDDDIRDVLLGLDVGITIDDERTSLLELGFATDLSGYIKIGDEVGKINGNVEMLSDLQALLGGITVYKFHHNPNWSVNNVTAKNADTLVTYGLTRDDSAICQIYKDEPTWYSNALKGKETAEQVLYKSEQKNKGVIIYSDLYPDTLSLTESDGSTVTEEIEKGFGASGGIVGMIGGHGSKEGSVTISLALSYSLNLPDFGVAFVAFLESGLESIVFSNGIAGGIVGVSLSKLNVTSVFNYSNVVGRMSGGIVGLGNSGVVIESYKESSFTDLLNETISTTFTTILQASRGDEITGSYPTTKYGPVMNCGAINGSLYAGGIFGYANGGRVNSAKMEELFYKDHSLGLYTTGTWRDSTLWDVDAKIIKDLNLGCFGNLWYFSITNAGTVVSNRFAGGIAGYMTGGSEIYNAKVTGNILSLFSDLDWIDFADNFCQDIHIIAPYSGGLVGYLENGKIGGSCSAGYEEFEAFGDGWEAVTKFLNGIKEIRVSSYMYDYTWGGKTVYRGGYAGGVVGLMTDGTLGTTFASKTATQKMPVSVNETMKFGVNGTGSYIMPYVGGAIGCYARFETGTTTITKYIGSVNVQTTVSGGLITGGLFGKIMSNSNLRLSFNEDSNTPYIIGTPLEYNKDGDLVTDKSDVLIVKGQTGTFCGGLVGYLENSIIENIFSCVRIEGDKGCTIGGIIGWLNGGTLQNCMSGQLATKIKTEKVPKKDSNGNVITDKNGNVKTKEVDVEYLCIDWDPKQKNDDEIYLFNVNTTPSFSSDQLITYTKKLVSETESSESADSSSLTDDLVSIIKNAGVNLLTQLFSQSYVGGIAGRLSSNSQSDSDTYAMAVNCAMFGNMHGGTNTGGIVGCLYGYAKVRSCYNFGNIEDANNAGGIVGVADNADSHKNGTSAIIEQCYVGRDLLVSEGMKAGGMQYVRSIIEDVIGKDGKDTTSLTGTSSSEIMTLFTYEKNDEDTYTGKIYMYNNYILVDDFESADKLDLDGVKELIGEYSQTISGSLCVGGLVGSLKGYSQLKSGKVGRLVQVKTSITDDNRLGNNLTQMLYAAYGQMTGEENSTIKTLFNGIYGEVDGVGAVGGVVGCASEHAVVGADAKFTTNFLKTLADVVVKAIFEINETDGSMKEGLLQGAGKVSGWVAGSLVGKLVGSAEIQSGVTGFLVQGSVYAGGIVGYMDTENGVSGVKNYSDYSDFAFSLANGVYALSSLENEDDEEETTNSSSQTTTGADASSEAEPETTEQTTIDETTDVTKYLKTSLGGLIGYYHNGTIDASNVTPMNVVGLSTTLTDLVSDKYFAGGIFGHINDVNIDVNNITLSSQGLSLVAGNLSYAGAIAGRISGANVNIQFDIKAINTVYTALNNHTVQAIKGAGGVVGAITNNSKLSFTSASVSSLTEEETTVWLYATSIYKVSIDATVVGGVVGAVLNKSTLKLVHNFETNGTLGKGLGEFIGGIAGLVSSGGTIDGRGYSVFVETILDGYNAFKKTDSDKTIGGIVGSLDGGTIKNITNAIAIKGGHQATVGGIVGVMTGGSVESCTNGANLSLNNGNVVADDDNPWRESSRATSVTNTGLTYDAFMKEGYDKGSIGGIVGKVSKFSFSQLLTVTDFTSVTDSLGGSQSTITDCTISTGSIKGYYYYGAGALNESRTYNSDKVYENHIVDNRGRFVGSTQQLGQVTITGKGTGTTKTLVCDDFKLSDLLTPDGIVDLLTTNLENYISNLPAKYLNNTYFYPAYAGSWSDRNSDETAFIAGYEIIETRYEYSSDGEGGYTETKTETKKYSFSAINGKPYEDGFEKSQSSVLNHLEKLTADTAASKGIISTSAKVAAQSVAFGTIETNADSLGVLYVNVVQNETSGDHYEFDTHDAASHKNGSKYEITHFVYDLETLSIVLGSTYKSLQNCGGHISYTRNARAQAGYTSEEGARSILLDLLYSINGTAENTLYGILSDNYKIYY